MSKKSAQEASVANADQALQDELNNRAETFSKQFAKATYEMGEAQNFIRELCGVYGLNYLRSVDFERRIQKSSGRGINRIDGFFPGLLLIEMKSAGQDLAEAYEQAKGYLPLLRNPAEIPRYILVSDFQNLHLYDLQAKSEQEPLRFPLAQFREHVNALDFLLGYERVYQELQERITQQAATALGALHDAVKKDRYPQADLQTLLVRILFCLFAEDTDIFGEGESFKKLIASTPSDGRGLGATLGQLFLRLNTGPEERAREPAFEDLTPEEQDVHAFPYINGDLFSQPIAPGNFRADTRKALLECCQTDWADISPDIFGSLFQYIMHWEDEDAGGKSKKRHEFGAHYTSERNILRCIRPLFLDDLQDALSQARGNAKALKALHLKLRQTNVLDPACGCGNFLVVTYRELRYLEERVLQALADVEGTRRAPECNVDQFFGIEIDPTAVEIATVAMWLTDHQLNVQFGAQPRIPLRSKARIVCANALRQNWNEVIAASDCHFIVGNPPFLGSKVQNDAQRAELAEVCKDIPGAGVLDYVSGWYIKAFGMMQRNPAIQTAFVSTNSITQGEQVAVLWQALMGQGLHIRFAHRTFRWNNEGAGVAAVHCVIVGMTLSKPAKCKLWDYGDDIGAEPRPVSARRINGYLVDAPLVFLDKRRQPICDVPEIGIGNKPIDDGNYLFTTEERDAFIAAEPASAKWFRRWLGADEFINRYERWCLWLGDCTEAELRAMPLVLQRVEAVRAFRLSSKSAPTQKLTEKPTRFHVENMPTQPYMILPEVSSERRRFIPFGFEQPSTLCSNLVKVAPNASLFHFGVLSSTMHNAWVRATCGRLESRYRYSKDVVYNNYPWPKAPSAQARQAVEAVAQAVLDARSQYPDKSLAWLYNPETMPAPLRDAHDTLDVAVDDAYGYGAEMWHTNQDAPRVSFLFERYRELTTLLPSAADAPAPESGKTRRPRANAKL